MKTLTTLIQPAFDWTWKNSLQVALLVGLVLLVQTVLARWLTPRLRYGLSLLILLRLLLPAVPSSPLSLENLFRPAARIEAHSLAPERGRLGEVSAFGCERMRLDPGRWPEQVLEAQRA